MPDTVFPLYAVPQGDDTELQAFGESFLRDILQASHPFFLYEIATLVTSRVMGERFWSRTTQRSGWARLYWSAFVAKLCVRHPQDQPVLLLNLGAYLGWLAQAGGVTPQELAQARQSLAFRTEGALCVTHLLQDDLMEVLQDVSRDALLGTWLSMQLMLLPGTFTPRMEQRRAWAQDLLGKLAPKAEFVQPQSAFCDVYFADDATRYAQVRDAFVAWGRAHGQVQNYSGNKLPKPQSGKKPRVGIASANWHQDHSSYKALSRQVRVLAERFELVLVNLAPGKPLSDTKLFSRVIDVRISLPQNTPRYLPLLDDAALRAAKLDVLYFAEVYTQETDSLLALRRYAPIQVTGYGFFSSTHAPFIDWYITGRAIEPELIQPQYSERICQVPGMGLLSSRRPPAAPYRFEDGRARITSTASLQKYRTSYLQVLADVARQCPQAKLLLLPNRLTLQGLWMQDELLRIMPENTECMLSLRENYLNVLAGSVLLLDSFPFGGYTTVIDALCMGVPVVTSEGFGAAHRAGAAVARAAGMPEWTIARNEEQYLQAALRILRDDGLRSEMARQVEQGLDALFSQSQEHHLADALEAILRNPRAPHLTIS